MGILGLAVLAGVGWSCAETQEEDSLINYSKTAQLNYDRGMEELEDEDCSEAQKLFLHVRKRYPYSRYAALAELRSADCDYVDGKFSEAAVAYQQFVKVHAAHPEAHYAAFRQALSYYRLIPSEWFLVPPTHERDLSAAHDAQRAMRIFLTGYPRSGHAAWAKKLLDEVERILASHEIYAAGFYRRAGNLEAAANRLKAVLARYPDSKLAPEASYQLAVTYLELQWPCEAKKTFERLEAVYPESHQALRAKDYLSDIGKDRDLCKPRNNDG